MTHRGRVADVPRAPRVDPQGNSIALAVKAETPDEVAGRILKASLKVREADSKSIWLAVQKDVMAQLEAAAAAKAAAPAQPATPPPATTLKFGKPQDEVLAAEEAAFKALIESKASSAPDMAALEAAQAEVATALLEASRSVKRMTMSEIWALAESAEEKEEAASEPAPAPSQEDDAAMLAEAVAILRMSEQTRGIDARSVWKAVQEDVAAQIEAAKAAAAAKPAPTPAAAPAVGLKFGMPADDVLKAEDAAFSALIQAARASQPVESAIADRLAAREQAEAELAAALVESARNLKRMSMAEVYELAAKFDAESSVEAEAPTAEAPDTAQVIKSIADQTCSIDTASVWKAVQADVAAQLEERAKAAAAAAAKAPAKPAPAPQGLKFAKSAKDALAKEESAFAALPTASGAGVDMAAREEAEKGVAEKIMAAARKAGRVTMGEVAKKAEEFDRRAAAEAAMPEEFKQAIADEKAAFGAVKEAGAAARADPGAAQEARKSGMAQLAEAVLERARGMPKTVDIAGAFTAIQRERAEAAARAAAERDAKIKQSMEEEEALFALAREATLAMRSQKNAGDSTRDQAMEEAARQILRAARDGPRVTPSELIEAMSRIEEAPPSMRPPSSGSPVPRLSTLHVPEFIADNGDKGYFIVDLGLSEGHDPDRWVDSTWPLTV